MGFEPEDKKSAERRKELIKKDKETIRQILNATHRPVARTGREYLIRLVREVLEEE